MIDVVENQAGHFPVLPDDTGFVRLVDVMPRLVPEGQTADSAIVQAARVSYGDGTKKVNDDRGLIRYLYRHAHSTPFEMVRFKFHLKMPLFVYRQFFRHRSITNADIEVISCDESIRKFASMNEYSARYSVVKDDSYLPDSFRGQSSANKQGGEEPIAEELNEAFQSAAYSQQVAAYALYESMLKAGVSRELARVVLPVGYTTEFYCTVDLWNLLHFLKLRCSKHAQKEIRVFADCMSDIVKAICPITHEAWVDYSLEAATFSRAELAAIRVMVAEYMAYQDKCLGDEIRDHLAKITEKLSSRELNEFHNSLFPDG